MTNEIEKQFFDTFGIKPKYTYLVTDIFYTDNAHTYTATKDDLIDYFESKNCGRYKVIEVYKTHPYITDHILLELICIAHTSPVITFVSRDVKSLKEEVLMVLCNWVSSRNIKQQVQAIFKGGNNND